MGSSTSLIHHNLFNKNGGDINVLMNSPAKFYNNTIVNSAAAGIMVPNNDAIVINNVVVGCASYGINSEGRTPLIDFNDF